MDAAARRKKEAEEAAAEKARIAEEEKKKFADKAIKVYNQIQKADRFEYIVGDNTVFRDSVPMTAEQLAVNVQAYVNRLDIDKYMQSLQPPPIPSNPGATMLTWSRLTRTHQPGTDRVKTWLVFSDPASVKLKKKYEEDILRSERYNEFVARVFQYELELIVTQKDKKDCTLSFYVDMEARNSKISYCIYMNSLYDGSRQIGDGPVILHRIAGYETILKLDDPNADENALVRAEIRKGLVYSALANGQKLPEHTNGRFTLDFQTTTMGIFTAYGAATIDTSVAAGFCSVSVVWKGSNQSNAEVVTCNSFNDFLAWIRDHPPVVAAAKPLGSAAALERAVDRLLAVLAIE